MSYLHPPHHGDATGRVWHKWAFHAWLPRISGRHGTNDMDDVCRGHPSSPKRKRRSNHPTLGLVMRCLRMAQHERHPPRSHLPTVAHPECSTQQPRRKLFASVLLCLRWATPAMPAHHRLHSASEPEMIALSFMLPKTIRIGGRPKRHDIRLPSLTVPSRYVIGSLTFAQQKRHIASPSG
jgi:hypothetical protein